MDHPMCAGSEGDFRLGFEPRVRLEFHGSNISSDGGLLLYRELDEALGLFDKTVRFLRDTRKGKNGVHTLMGLLRWAFCANRSLLASQGMRMSTMQSVWPVIP